MVGGAGWGGGGGRFSRLSTNFCNVRIYGNAEAENMISLPTLSKNAFSRPAQYAPQKYAKTSTGRRYNLQSRLARSYK